MINPASAENTVRQIEIKAYVDDYQALCQRVAALANRTPPADFKFVTPYKAGQAPVLSVANTPIDRIQDDTFFNCRSGRLKLRSSGQYHDLIFYRRENDYGPSESLYQFAPTKNPAALRTSLTSAFGEAGRVKKFRRTFRVGSSIIHLDRVGGLGDFIEIKVELDTHSQCSLPATSLGSRTSSSALTAQKGAQLVENWMSLLDVDLFQLVDGAYVDLINERDQT